MSFDDHVACFHEAALARRSRKLDEQVFDPLGALSSAHAALDVQSIAAIESNLKRIATSERKEDQRYTAAAAAAAASKADGSLQVAAAVSASAANAKHTQQQQQQKQQQYDGSDGSCWDGDVWRCDVCNKEMQSVQRAAHIKGKRHLALVGENKSATADVVVSKPQQQPQKTTGSAGNGHDEHCYSVVSATSSEQQQQQQERTTTNASSFGGMQGKFHCDVCNKTMQMVQKKMHIMGAKHKQKVAEAYGGAAKNDHDDDDIAVPDGIYHCLPCGIFIPFHTPGSSVHEDRNIQEHLAGTRHKKAVAAARQDIDNDNDCDGGSRSCNGAVATTTASASLSAKKVTPSEQNKKHVEQQYSNVYTPTAATTAASSTTRRRGREGAPAASDVVTAAAAGASSEMTNDEVEYQNFLQFQQPLVSPHVQFQQQQQRPVTVTSYWDEQQPQRSTPASVGFRRL